jgi:hypothetical protein
MKIKPHTFFDIIRPDEVAECWEGVTSAGLYQPLWDCVDHYTAPSPEVSEEPCWGMDCVADFWDRFTPEQQLLLNQLAVRNDPRAQAEARMIDIDSQEYHND